jgi:chaperonin GroES
MADEILIEEPAAPVEPSRATGEQILFAIMSMPNIAQALAGVEGKLSEIATQVIEGYDIDEASRDDWLKKNKEAMKLAMLVSERKDYPFENSANVKFPLLTTAALQFNARAYPAIVAPDRVVKCKVRGRDEQGVKAARADRVSEYMSDQLLHEMPEWEEDTDRILVMLPIVGAVFRKVWYDPALKRNISRLVTAENLVVNACASSLLTVPRITEKLMLYPYEIEERIRDGRFIEFDYKNLRPSDDGKKADGEKDDSAPHLFLEQHRLLDLDEDGYPEPYIVTIHKDSLTVVRIIANFDQDSISLAPDRRVAAIRRNDYFVHYQFLPDPQGGFYGLGFGWLLSSTNETINSTLNQLLDAGHMANMQGGLISSVLGVKEKSIRTERGEWRVINTGGMKLSEAVLPMKYGEPSTVLFQLLGLMIEMGKEVASVKDVLTGEQRPNQTATATLALIEQGLQVFTSIYKRIHRSVKHELAIYARLNEANVTPEAYSTFFDMPADPQADFNGKDMDILPVSDPQSVTKMQKLAKAQFIYETAKDNPLINPEVATRRMLEAADVEDVDDLIVQPPQPDPGEVAFMEAMRDLELQDKVADIKKKLADSMKSIAAAEGEEAGTQIGFYRLVLETLLAEVNAEQQANAGIGPGGVSDMAGTAPDPAGAGPLPPAGGGGAIPSPAAPVGGPDVGAQPVGAPAGAGGVPQGAL